MPNNSFEEFKQKNLSKIHSYTDETKKTIYFYFFKGQRSDYYALQELRNLSKKIEELEKELLIEYKSLKQS